jgi:hypothetical protein
MGRPPSWRIVTSGTMPPAILLAFADDWADDKRRLRNLLTESKAIRGALAPLVTAGALEVPDAIHNATVDDVIAAFRDRRNRRGIRIFHFAGHASGSALIFETESGASAEAHAGGLAGYLGQQRGLVLVFLNGCCTEPQVQQLRRAGVKAVVATTASIDDAVAAEFATAFYAELATHPLREAFDAAVHSVRMRWGDDPRAVTRDVQPLDDGGQRGWPWIIDCDPAIETWRIGSRSGRLRWLLAALVLSASLVVGAIAVIASPGAAERALWKRALAMDSGDGLREYLGTYPKGAFVEEARSRLAGCRMEETLGPAHDVTYRLPVNTKGAWPSEDEARRDARERGDQDAADACASLAFASVVLSSQAKPRDTGCRRDDDGVRCGFEGDVVCRIQDKLRVERCRQRNGPPPEAPATQ